MLCIGHDIHALLFNWMDECLFLFAGDLFVAKVRPSSTGCSDTCGAARGRHFTRAARRWVFHYCATVRHLYNMFLTFTAVVTSVSCRHGEKFDRAKHPQGTEVKAITYSAMQVCWPFMKHVAY